MPRTGIGEPFAVETYRIDYDGHVIIYRPRRRLAFLGNQALAGYVAQREAAPDAPRDPEVEEFLTAVGYDGPLLDCPPFVPGDEPPRPTHAVLLLTNRCNLRCVYCYANAGAEPVTREMDWPTAQAVLDTVLANAAAGDQPPALTFHGGGEPTAHWALLERAVHYLKERDPRATVSMSSNGVWTAAQREFVCAEFADVSLSMDGLPAVQDRQRPTAGGTATAAQVHESIRALEAAGISYGLRLTVMPESVADLPAGVTWILEHTQCPVIQVEPTFTTTRGVYGDLSREFATEFAARFMEAQRLGAAAGRQVYYSGGRLGTITPVFCQAPLSALVATADGRLVTCFEVFSELSPLAQAFTVGRVADGRAELDLPALSAYLAAQQTRRAECVTCFCYWQCAGDCATRRPDPSDTAGGRCHVTREVTRALLLAELEQGEGVWHGLAESGANQEGPVHE